MTRLALSVLVLGVIMSASCGAEDTPPEGDPAALCDGSAGPTLHVGLAPAGIRLAGSMVREENGLPYLLVDGSCRFWVTSSWIAEGPTRKDRELRTGTLSREEASALAGSFPRGALAGALACRASSVVDKAPRVAADPSSAASCVAGGEAFEAAWKRVASIAATLWGRGAAETGALRVATYPQTREFDPGYPWPLAASPSSFPGRLDNAPGTSWAVDAEADVRALRELRRLHLASKERGPEDGDFGPKVSTSDGRAWTLYMRDACPHELPSGLLPF